MRFASRALIPLLCIALLASCATDPHDRPVTLSLTNAGSLPLSCRLQFGHWVDRDLGTLAPGAATDIVMMQATEDGALYVMRADGERQMMIETIQCARPGDWFGSFGQVDLGPVRKRPTGTVEASCAAPAGDARVACRLDRLAP